MTKPVESNKSTESRRLVRADGTFSHTHLFRAGSPKTVIKPSVGTSRDCCVNA
ncbi:MAG: hypothetical protein IKC59_05480 [Clostridia bacterium]|nr:hypothetical protein [Clostridia bacterium]